MIDLTERDVIISKYLTDSPSLSYGFNFFQYYTLLFAFKLAPPVRITSL